jgi:hypothetical protein
MKNNIAFLRNAILITLLCSVNVSVSRAQAPCPTDIPPTTGLDTMWFSGGTTIENIGGTDCDILVWYCYRNLLNGTSQIYIYRIEPLNSDCDELTWHDIIDDAIDGIYKVVSAGTCSNPPCSGGLTTVAQVYTSQCFKMVLNSTGTGANLVFCTNGAYCLKTCTICKLGGVNIQCSCYYSSISSPSCEPTPENFGNMTVADFQTADYNTQSWPWTPGTCYTVDCGEN